MKYLVPFIFIAALVSGCGGSAEEPQTETTALQTTESGLQYEIIAQGEGPTPEAGQIVKVHYTGSFKATGEKFDSSVDRGEPITFKVGIGQVIPGWDEGIMLLNKGSKAMLYIPSNLAYGEKGRGGIPPNSDLNFEVEIIDILPAPKPIPHDPYPTDGLEMKTTESGLQYYMVEEGSGAPIQQGQVAEVHYAGYLQDGSKFDSSFERGEPFAFPVGMGRVIPGWDEGLQLTNVGSKIKLVIPYQLAYGEAGKPPVIPEKATLVFDVEVLGVK